MGGELKFTVTEHARVDKYHVGVTQEQIDAGTAIPYEVTEDTKTRAVSADEVRRMGLDPDAIIAAAKKEEI